MDVKTAAATDLAVVLHDLAWLLPRTLGAQAGAGAALPSSELEIMRLLVRRPGLSVNETAAALRLQSTNVSSALRALEARGLLERRRDRADGRSVGLYPTRAALAHRRRQERAWGKGLEAAIGELSTEDARELLAMAPALAALTTALGRQAADT